jgi:hypothetical protein
LANDATLAADRPDDSGFPAHAGDVLLLVPMAVFCPSRR